MSNTHSGGFQMNRAKEVARREDEGQLIELTDADGSPLTYPGEDGQPQPVWMRVAGEYSSVYRRATEQQQDITLKRRVTSLTGAMIQRQQVEVAAACVLEWGGFFDGEASVPHSRHNVVMVLQAAPWVYDQVKAAIGDHSGFFSQSASD